MEKPSREKPSFRSDDVSVEMRKRLYEYSLEIRVGAAQKAVQAEMDRAMRRGM